LAAADDSVDLWRGLSGYRVVSGCFIVIFWLCFCHTTLNLAKVHRDALVTFHGVGVRFVCFLLS